MFLIVNTCDKKLSELEFTRPIETILKKLNLDYEVKHYTEEFESYDYDKIIITGTALKDDSYLEELNKFAWIKYCKRPLLGICAGMQTLSLAFGGELKESKEIGTTKITSSSKDDLIKNLKQVYSLHQYSTTLPKKFTTLARSKKCIQAIKKDHLYGVLFHPEVST